ncbi:MAG: NADH-quinone oxidoreductase subunit N [Anaerolineales bacterium]|nr:NADH-quinone oxidoreductase subunit N [Chloroflexota bacterium]MBL6980412.1 NADH-quinone oxidoreductase subunit N [Anaerolineales bacterium]
MTSTDFLSILPIIILVAWGCVLLLVDVFSKKNTWLTPLLAAAGLMVTLVFSIVQSGTTYTGFNGMVVVDGFSGFLNVLFAVSGLAGIALSFDYNKRMGLDRGEYYILLLFSISGMMLMSVAADLIVVFLALELLSIPLYVLAGFARPKLDSEEAAMKYFLLGAFAGGFVVYGVALAFGATGSTALGEIVAAVNTGTADLTLLTIGAGLIIVGFGFKVAVVPFQMWTPDVYQGAPTGVTAFMAVGAKAAGFAALLRVFVAALPTLYEQIVPIMWVMAALTMIVGNIVAIAQSNIKRMLAYSSIAHAGYIFMALVAFGQADVAPDAVSAALFYLLAYAVTNFGAWAVVIALEKSEGKGLQLDDYAGLGRKYPALAAAMLVFMLSFTGVPPTLGFMGKFFLFRTVLQAGFVWLAIIGVLTSLISAYYYLRVLVIMYMRDGDPEVNTPFLLNLTTGLTAVGTVVLSIVSVPLFKWASQAVLKIF